MLAGDQRVLGEARIGGGVFHHHHVVARGNGMGAEGQADRRFALIDADGGFEPFTIEIDKRDQRDWRLHQGCCDAGQPVEVGIGRGVERFQPAKHRPPAIVAHGPPDIVRKLRPLLDCLVPTTPHTSSSDSQNAECRRIALKVPCLRGIGNHGPVDALSSRMP